MDFSELFTDSARRLLPVARSKRLVSYFDYSGLFIDLAGNTAGVRSGLHRIMAALVELVEDGFVMFHADVMRVHADEACLITVHAAANVCHPEEPRVLDALQRLRLDIVDGPVDALPTGHPATASVRAVGRCPSSGADVTFSLVPEEGMVFSWRWQCGVECPCTEHPVPRAEGAHAWLVDTVPNSLDCVRRRLQRAGWRTDRYQTLGIVGPLLRARPADAPPLLVILSEADRGDLAWLEAFARAPAPARLVLAVLAGSPSLRSRHDSPVDIRVLPLSPREMDAFTRHVDPSTSTPFSRCTVPAPLYAADRHLALVADDNRLNRLVAQGLLEALGYDVAVVGNGEQAIASCLQQAPDVVLMDLDMPVMSGLEATHRIRAMQRDGGLPPFAIVAATAFRAAGAQEQCMAAGMDGFLEKPLRHQALACELQRVVPERATW